MGSSSAVANELEAELINAANKLLKPPSNTQELLDLLSKLEHLLSKVEQTPSDSMLEALRPSIDAILIDEVLRHSDSDVKISVAYCFSEIMRITAPKEPFNDDQMKEFFHLTVTSFQKFSTASGGNYSKISTILRIFSHFRLCVLILDLELNELVVQMFQHFFNLAGSNISDPLLSHIRDIMTMVIEESEVFAYELLSLLITSVKNENQHTSPYSWTLGEELLKSCAGILKPCLPEVVKRMRIDLNDYSKTVASICQDESTEENLEANEHAPAVISSGEATPSVNDIAQMRKDEAMDIKDTRITLSRCNQATEPKSADADACMEAVEHKPLELGYTDNTSSKRPIKPNPKYEEGYNSGLVVITPDWTNHGKRTRNSSNSPATMVLALPSGQKSETKPRQRKSESTPRTQKFPTKRHLGKGKGKEKEKEKDITTNQIGGLNLLSDTLGDFLRAQAGEKALQRGSVSLKKESDGTGSSKAKRKKRAITTKIDELCNDRKGQQESQVLKEDAKRLSKDGDSHRTVSTEHTDSLSDAASKVKRKNRTPLNEKGAGSYMEKHGGKLVGCKIKVWWPMDEMFYEGVITSFDQSTKMHEVTYLDDEVEVLNLRSERWQLVSDVEHQGVAANSSVNTHYEDQTYSWSPQKKRQKGPSGDSLIADVLAKKHGMHPPIVHPQADSGSQTNSSISRDREGEKQLALMALPVETLPLSSSQTVSTCLEMVDIQGYKVKPCNGLILVAIFAKHGDIAADCTFKSPSVRASLLEVICEVVKKIQSNNIDTILSEIEMLEHEVGDIKEAKVNVSWLQDHLERYKRLKEAVEKGLSLKKVKVNAGVVSKAAKREVEERLAGLIAAEKCLKGLEFVTKKINSDILECESQESYWRMKVGEELLL